MSMSNQGDVNDLQDSLGGLSVEGTLVEGGAILPSSGAGYSDREVRLLSDFQEWLRDGREFVDEQDYPEIAKMYLVGLRQ